MCTGCDPNAGRDGAAEPSIPGRVVEQRGEHKGQFASGARGAEPDEVETRGTDPDLRRVVLAWPELPEPMKAAVLALISVVDAGGKP